MLWQVFNAAHMLFSFYICFAEWKSRVLVMSSSISFLFCLASGSHCSGSRVSMTRRTKWINMWEICKKHVLHMGTRKRCSFLQVDNYICGHCVTINMKDQDAFPFNNIFLSRLLGLTGKKLTPPPSPFFTTGLQLSGAPLLPPVLKGMASPPNFLNGTALIKCHRSNW